MKVLTVIIPVYNEARQLVRVFDALFKSPCPVTRQWIVVDDYSTDGSRELLRKLREQYGFLLVEQPKNGGKGLAIRAGIEAATGDVVIIQDADFEYDPSDIPSLIQPILEDRADVVYGSRFRQNSPQVHRTYHYFVNRLLTVLSNLMSGIYLTDMETCYKAFRGDLLKSMQLRSERFGIEVELTAYVAKTVARVYELPIHYYPRTRLQGKKINWRDGVAAIWHIFRFNYLISEEAAFKVLASSLGRNTSQGPIGPSPGTRS